MAVARELDDGQGAQGVPRHRARILAPVPEGENEREDDAVVDEPTGKLPRSAPGVSGIEQVHDNEPTLGYSGVDGPVPRPVEYRAPRLLSDVATLGGRRPIARGPQCPQLRGVGWSTVGVGAGQLDVGVPRVAVDVAGNRRGGPGGSGQTEQDGQRDHQGQRHPGRQPAGRPRAHEPYWRPHAQDDDETPAGTGERVLGNEPRKSQSHCAGEDHHGQEGWRAERAGVLFSRVHGAERCPSPSRCQLSQSLARNRRSPQPRAMIGRDRGEATT